MGTEIVAHTIGRPTADWKERARWLATVRMHLDLVAVGPHGATVLPASVSKSLGGFVIVRELPPEPPERVAILWYGG